VPVEIGQLEVVSPPAQNGAATGDGAAPPPAASSSGAQLALEVERTLALEHTRDLRLRAD
jgi:hypothetical protein